MSEIIRLKNVVKMAGSQRIINDVSFIIHEGEYVEIRGGDESCRAMLMKLLAGMERPNAGEISVIGKTFNEMDADQAADFRNRSFGVCLREPSFIPHLSVWENVALPLAIRGIAAHQRERAAKEQLKQLGIRQIAYAYPAQLKSREAQIASIARAVVTQPPVLLLQEMTVGLSEKQAGQVTDVLNFASADATIIHFTSGENVPGAQRLLVLEHGTTREEIL